MINEISKISFVFFPISFALAAGATKRAKMRMAPTAFIAETTEVEIRAINSRSSLLTLIPIASAPSGSKEIKRNLMKKIKPKIVKLNDLLHEYDLIPEERDLVKFWGYDKI